MEYPLENLTPDSFQQLVQALLVKEHPDLQCFPVGQADGGRDAIAYSGESVSGWRYALFQMKFTRFPAEVTDPDKWMIDALAGELPKIHEQRLKGADRYVIITNVRGTAKLASGTMDKVQKYLTKNIPIPAMCWWRDDLARRLDTAWDIKWAYPEILTGPDILRAVLSTGLDEHKERRTAAITAAVAHQYVKDRDLKFKQIDLQSRVLDLFVDTPIAAPKRSSATTKLLLNTLIQKHGVADDGLSDADDPAETSEYLGAASLLLAREGQHALPLIVIEGGPGQGKSTLTQYVAQVHRLRILDKRAELAQLPESHKVAPTRLPIRVDLRDLASWLSGKDPFNAGAALSADLVVSLESFLAALIRSSSGGARFDVTDLLAVAKISSLLLVLDGLDEVADITARKQVVNAIIDGSTRLVEGAASIQIVVTTRPAAFANSPGLPEDRFIHLRLGSLTKRLILDYGQKWTAARHFTPLEKEQVLQTLQEKMSLPHLKDLSRNPMQLTILLSLMHSRGVSLPDKRTALYDSYMDLFFSREAEKSPIVREHRDVLISLHRRIAWLIHSETELGNSDGRVTMARLQSTITEYLAADGHDPSIGEKLLQGAVERVGALVARVEGTFEFEVQPLREYFAARYLYDTAPSSSPGAEKRGAKPDRFAALARNYYWFNVARFYAGCHSKGELASLTESIRELLVEPPFVDLTHPRSLALNLVSDWVFSQYPKSIRLLLDIVLDGKGLRQLIAKSENEAQDGLLGIADPYARDHMVTMAWSLFKGGVPSDMIYTLARMVKAYGQVDANTTQWLSLFGTIPKATAMLVGYYIGLLKTAPDEDVLRISSADDPEDIALLIATGRQSFIYAHEPHRATFERLVLSGMRYAGDDHSLGPLEALARAVDTHRYEIAFRHRDPQPLRQHWRQLRHLQLGLPESLVGSGREYDVARAAVKLSEALTIEWATRLDHWDELTELIRSNFGDCWIAYRLASAAAGIRRKESGAHNHSLFDMSVSLCKRARSARLLANYPDWWRDQLTLANTQDEKAWWLHLLCRWASARTIDALREDAASVATSLGEEELGRTCRSLYPRIKRGGKLLGPTTSPRLGMSLLNRSSMDEAYEYYRKQIREHATDPLVMKAFLPIAIDAVFRAVEWKKDLDYIRRCCAAGVETDLIFGRWLQEDLGPDLAVEIASAIVSDPDHYPMFLLHRAEVKLRKESNREMKPLASSAENEGWFAESL